MVEQLTAGTRRARKVSRDEYTNQESARHVVASNKSYARARLAVVSPTIRRSSMHRRCFVPHGCVSCTPKSEGLSIHLAAHFLSAAHFFPSMHVVGKMMV